eukprot:scaffold97092_cov59-Attheya_sp.AAC.2
MEVHLLKKCPPLTGPPIALDQPMEISLAPDDYQYDSFFLHKGSTLSVTVDQTQGATNIYMIQGKKQFQEWQENDGGSSSVKKRHKHYVGQGQDTQTFSWTAHKSDTYVVVYDNASGWKGHATVHYHVNLTTYQLENDTTTTPFCPIISTTTDSSDTTPCQVDLEGTKRFRCILVQATSDQPDVTVTIQSERRWSRIFLVSLLPIAMAFLLEKVRHVHSDDHDDDNARPPAFVPAEETPVAKATKLPQGSNYQNLPTATAVLEEPMAPPNKTYVV